MEKNTIFLKKKNGADLLTGLKLIGKNGKNDISLFQYKKIGDKKSMNCVIQTD